MIPFIDTAMCVFIKSMFMNYPVVFAPPDVGQQALARDQQQATRGLPGITVWRMATPKDKRVASTAQGGQGYIQSRESNGQYDAVKLVRVRPVYTIAAWSKDLSDRDTIERTLAFADIYNTFSANIKVIDENGIEQLHPIQTAFEGEDPTYEEVPDAKSGKILWYGLKKDFSATAAWMNTDQVPYVGEILVKVNEVRNGQPIEMSSLNQIFDVLPKT